MQHNGSPEITQTGPTTIESFVDREPSSYITRETTSQLAVSSDRVAWWIVLSALSLTVLEGAIRKWVIGGAFNLTSYAVYFSKDIVFALLLFLPPKKIDSPGYEIFRRWLIPGCFLIVCGAVSSATSQVNLVGAVLTLRAALVLPIIAFWVVLHIHDVSLRSIAWFIGLLTILNFALSVVQNQLPAGHVLNRYVTDAVNITVTATGVRATGTFSYISGLAVMSMVGVWSGLVQISLGKNVRQQTIGWAVVSSGVGCGLASVSRAPILVAVMILSIWTLAYGNKILTKAQSLAGALLLVAIGLFFGLTTTFIDLGEGLLIRSEGSSEEATDRIFGQFGETISAVDMAPLGIGLGTEQVGRNAYSEGVLSHTAYESQLPRIVLEIGILGLIGFLIVCGGALLALQVAKQLSTTSGEKAALLVTQLFLLMTFASNVIFNHVASAFVWIIFSVVMASLPSMQEPLRNHRT